MIETTKLLSEFAVRPEADLPETVLHEAKRSLVNWLGCALGGARHPTMEIALGATAPHSGGDATVLGRAERLGALDAAFANCLASSANAFDDTHLATVVHPTGPVAAALLAAAEGRAVSGRDFLEALAIGIEVECRVAMMLVAPPAEPELGWYLTGTTGGIGAAAAAARLLGLDVERTIYALGIAAAQASGFRQTHASMIVAMVPGVAARAGLWAALLAEKGYTSTSAAIEGGSGFAELFSRKAHAPAATDTLGAEWEILANAYKPYPCGIVIHPVIDACLEIAAEPGFDQTAVAAIRLVVNPLCLRLCDRPEPPGAQEAMVSVHHWTAATLARGRAGLAEGTEAAVADPEILRLRALVETAPDDAIGREGALVTVEMADGSRHEVRIDHALGSLERPMSDVDLDEKFLVQAVPVLRAEGAAGLLTAGWSVAGLADAGELARLARPAG